MAELFAVTDYRSYLKARIAEESVRGYQRRLAAAAGCRPSYLSQVLNLQVQLTPDHAVRLASFWGFCDDETEYFLALVQLDRCGSMELRKFLTRRMAALRQERQRISRRIESPKEVALEKQVGYFSQPMTAAIHLATRIKDLRRSDAIASRLGIPETMVRNQLENLRELGLVKGGPTNWTAVEDNLHLGDSAPLAWVNHSNWRQQVVHRIQQGQRNGTHYTALYSLAESDLASIREEMLQLIERSRRAVATSADQTLCCMLCDIWEI